MRRPARPLLAVLLLPLLLLAACGSDGDGDTGADTTDETSAPAGEDPTTVRLGYFPNITHAPAIAGVEEGIFEEALGENTLEVTTFNAGPQATEALLSGAIDASFIGPNPAINAFAQSNGDAIRIISGTTSGGASLIVKPEITSAADLEGKKLATPQLGNTQDVALRFWLQEEGLSSDPDGGGDVSILPQENSQTLDAFKAGQVDGAWVPEPWASRLILEGGGKVLVDEADLWPDGKFVTTHLIVATKFLEEHPGAVTALLEGLLQATELVNGDAAAAQKIVNDGIEEVTGKRIADATVVAAWENLEFTVDPIAASLAGSKDHAVAVGLLEDVDLEGIYALDLLNAVLADAGEPEVQDS